MSFEPKPGMKIVLDGEAIEFVALETSSGSPSVFVYAEAGKEGTVYKVLKNKKHYALKVFHPEYQDKRLIKNTEKLSHYKTLNGFRVTERTLINRKYFPDIVDEFPELNYSILMPWIQGEVWGNLMTSEPPLQGEKYVRIARLLMEIICDLETQGLAHCDLSNNNFIIDPMLSSIELIDIEDMYAPDMPRPIPDISYGTVGYRTKWIAENGLWGPNSDRFASAILCAEIITWQFKEIRENRAGDTSFFDENEIGQYSERYHLMVDSLGKLSLELSNLFQIAWISKHPVQCPSACEWETGLLKITDENTYHSLEEKFRHEAEASFQAEAEKMVVKLSENQRSSKEMEQRARLEAEEKARLEREYREKAERDAIGKVLKEKAEREDKMTPLPKKLKISIAFPKLLSKRFESPFLLQVYLPSDRSQVTRNIKSEFQKQKTNEHLQSSSIRLKQKIIVKFFSPTFDFSEPITKLIEREVNEFTLLGMPKDNCEPGLHKVLVSISDGDTGLEFESLTITAQVVDFAFDHVSRPFLSKTASVFLFIGSFVMFSLTLFEQIDKTIGLTSGTAAAVLSIVIYNNFYTLFQRVRQNTP